MPWWQRIHRNSKKGYRRKPDWSLVCLNFIKRSPTPLFIWGSLQCRVLVRPSPLDPECWAPHAYVAPPCWLAFLVFPLEKNNVWVHVGFACWLQVFEYGMCIWQSWERLPRLISFPISNSPLPFLPKVFSCLIKTLYTTTISKGNINALTLPIKDTNWEVID